MTLAGYVDTEPTEEQGRWPTRIAESTIPTMYIGEMKGSIRNHIHLHIPSLGTKYLSWLGVGLVIRGSLVRFPATPGTLVVLGQNSLFHIASVYPAAKWVPSINKAVLRVCVLYAASCSGILLLQSPEEHIFYRLIRSNQTSLL